MNKPLIAGLLTAWCVLLVAPAWIVYFVFRGIDADTPIIGPIIAIWIVGYLLQLGVFIAATRKASRNGIGGWFLASTMPFVADWTVPVAPWSPAAVLIVVGAYAAWFYSRIERSDELQRNGIPAAGTVLEIETPLMNTIINDVYIRRTMMLRIERSDGAAPYQAKYTGTFMLGEVPKPGDVFNVRIDPKDPHHLETTDETPKTSAPQNYSTVAEQLQQLDDMHRRGALTDDEFTEAKRRILRG
ncbi:SHOCT domain-containing protein [Mycolicibacterium hodleri]|uniref:SHOCT domain-containing protein n=1 Tax=Mycolicibacterium hodleri TaxID=49897 RepID=A0A502EHJ9_9MYCO|nr:SHOCT domain-containing protein [Mycolicibacterium hodleri]TPG37168.1 SHOCT domain-containing protein [Mycolicibacterium hodleri]